MRIVRARIRWTTAVIFNKLDRLDLIQAINQVINSENQQPDYVGRLEILKNMLEEIEGMTITAYHILSGGRI